MGTPQPFFRRALAVAMAVALPAAVLSVTAASTASADPANPTPVSSSALPTAQVNGVVWSQAVANGIDYVGGSFSQSQPAGAAAGANTTPRGNLFAFDIASGAAADFNATTNAQVRSIAVSPDGSRVYIAGDFTTVNGQPRHHLAALDTSGNLIASFAPVVNGSVYSVATRGANIYFGGVFTAVDGAARSRAASVSDGGSLLPFAPNVADFTVRAVIVSPDGGKVLLGGSFDTVNGEERYGLAALDANTGANLPWGTNAVIQDHGQNSAIFSLSARGDQVYATGYVYGGTGNLEGSVAMRWSDGGLVWIEDCHGDTYSSYPFNDALYIAGHPHFCGNVGGFGEMNPKAHRALAFSQAATHTLLSNTTQGPGYYVDFGGQPAPTLLDWYPTLTTGTYTGEGQAAWSVTGGGSYIIYAGEFTAVNGVRQTGLARFQGQPEPGDVSVPVVTPTPTPTPTPTSTPTSTPTTPTAPVNSQKPNRVSAPSTVALGPSAIAARWTAPKGAAASKISSYVVKVYKAGKAVKSVTVASTKRLVSISGLKRSTTYKVAVAARNARGTGESSKTSSVKTKAGGKNVSASKAPAKLKKPAATVGAARLRAKWAAASTSGRLAVSKYQVRLELHGKTVKTLTVNSRARAALVTGLKHHASYTVSVRAGSWAGWGSWSQARSAKTR